jgi:hypothetical protein
MAKKTKTKTTKKPRAAMALIEIEAIQVQEWHPLPNGQGKPTQVHLCVTTKQMKLPLVMRFKGRDTLDQIIDALSTHADNVFGPRGN